MVFCDATEMLPREFDNYNDICRDTSIAYFCRPLVKLLILLQRYSPAAHSA